ncbi:MAG: hypothetical protein LC777_12700 [Actinobacteria bacterium]|nr:hypothetical protein [Actinomycetota bacterium]
MTMPRGLVVIAAAVALSACGIPNPSAPSTPSPAPQRLRAPGAVVGVQDARVRLAIGYTLTQATWSPDSYLAQRGRLAELSIGHARAQLTPRDGQSSAGVAAALKAANSSSTATLLGADAPNANNEVVVAYKTHATGSARAADQTDYQIAHVTLTRRHGRWLVLNFAIQP